MSNALKIFACSGLSQSTDAARSQFETEGTVAVDNTQAMNSLLAKINLCATKIRKIKMSEADLIESYNLLVLYSVCFYFARLYKNDTETLKALSGIFASVYNSGLFFSTSTNAAEREAMVNDIIEKMENMLASGNPYIETQGAAWWNTNITNKNKVGLPAELREKISGIGATIKEDYGELNKYLYDGGTYFLYLFMTEQQLNNATYAIRKKYKKQMEVYNYCRNCFCKEYSGVYGSEEDMVNIIRAGIIEDFGETPEQVVSDILSGKSVSKEQVGITAIVLAAIITSVTTLILGVITVVCNYAASVFVAKYTIPENLEDGMASESDWDGLNAKNQSENSGLPLIILGGAALAFVLFSKNN